MRVFLALSLPVLRKFLLALLADFGAGLLLFAQLFLVLRLRRAPRLKGLRIARLPRGALLCVGQHACRSPSSFGTRGAVLQQLAMGASSWITKKDPTHSPPL